MTRLILAGDTHGDLDAITYLCKVANANGAERILQLGDFGLWPGKWGKKFLDASNSVLEAAGVELWWLDGNHEDHARIEEWSKRDNFYTELTEVRPHIHYMPRGYRFEVDGLRFMSLGGAWSIDKNGRIPFRDWWPQEELTSGDVERALSDMTPLDVLLTHDMPADHEAATALGVVVHSGGSGNRLAVSTVMKALDAKLLVHGHMHATYRATVGGTKVVGLDCNGTGLRSWALLDLGERQLDNAVTRKVQF